MKYTVTYAFNTPHYGDFEVEADSPEEAQLKVLSMWHKDEIDLICEPEPMLSDDYRIVSIEDENGECVDDGFDLPSQGVSANA